MNEYLLVLPVEPLMPGMSVAPKTPLPLHCTLMPWFSLGRLSLKDFEKGMRRIAGDFHPITLVGDQPDLLGPNIVPVHILRENEQLRLLHNTVYDFLSSEQCILLQRCYIGERYRPHVTSYAGKSFGPGCRHKSKCIVLVHREENGSKRITDFFMFKPRGRR